MSSELLQKSLELVGSADGLPSFSSFDDNKNKSQKKSKKLSSRSAQTHRSVFLPQKKAKVLSAIEEAKAKPKDECLKKNLKYMKYSSNLTVEEKTLRKLISIHQLPYKRDKRALQRYKQQSESDGSKPKVGSVFTEEDFKNWAKGLVVKKKY